MTYLIAYVVVIFLCGQLSGVGHWIRDTRRFQMATKVDKWMLRNAPQWLVEWWWGGNEYYNPSFGGDSQHWADSLTRVSWAFAALLSGMFVPILWWLGYPDWIPDVWLYCVAVATIIPSYYLGEWTFTILYHNLNLPKEHTDYVPFWKLIGNLLTPWRNFHK